MALPSEADIDFWAKLAGFGYKAYSKLVDIVAGKKKEDRDARYEMDKRRAWQESLRGDAADWDFVASVVEQAEHRGDSHPDTVKLRRRNDMFGIGVSTGRPRGKKAYKGSTKKKAAKKPAAKKPAAKKKAAKKPAVKRR